jgi:hypothetical protein
MPDLPTPEFFLKQWLKKRSQRADLQRSKTPSGNRNEANPKWNDDKWFEKKYGDPDYYKRVKGLN